MLGILALVGGVAVGILMAIPAKTLHNTPGLHRFETWQNRVSGFFEKEEVPAAKFDIDKDARYNVTSLVRHSPILSLRL